jgi:phosphoglycerate dehydrogenase-like enzyme
MTKIILEDDHILRIVAVILDPNAPEQQMEATCAFFAHDVPDFLGWCARARARFPGLAPADIVFVTNQAELAANIVDADAVIVESLIIDRPVLAAARRLALVQKFGTITNNIDLAACAERGVLVSTLRRRVNNVVAEQAFALLLALAKRIHPLAGVVEAEDLEAAGWRVRPRSPHAGYSNFAGVTGLKTVFGATLGIVGFGEVGREIARYAKPFEMETIYFQRRRLAEQDEQLLGSIYAPLDEVMARSDFLVVQLPLNDSTRGLIGRDQLRLMKPGAVLVNVARAQLIDHDALVEALAAGRLGGFGLDVGYAEPADPADPLLDYRAGNVILMPHTAIGSRENALLDLEQLCSNVWRAVSGQRAARDRASSQLTRVTSRL